MIALFAILIPLAASAEKPSRVSEAFQAAVRTEVERARSILAEQWLAGRAPELGRVFKHETAEHSARVLLSALDTAIRRFQVYPTSSPESCGSKGFIVIDNAQELRVRPPEILRGPHGAASPNRPKLLKSQGGQHQAIWVEMSWFASPAPIAERAAVLLHLYLLGILDPIDAGGRVTGPFLEEAKFDRSAALFRADLASALRADARAASESLAERTQRGLDALRNASQGRAREDCASQGSKRRVSAGCARLESELGAAESLLAGRDGLIASNSSPNAAKNAATNAPSDMTSDAPGNVPGDIYLRALPQAAHAERRGSFARALREDLAARIQDAIREQGRLAAEELSRRGARCSALALPVEKVLCRAENLESGRAGLEGTLVAAQAEIRIALDSELEEASRYAD